MDAVDTLATNAMAATRIALRNIISPRECFELPSPLRLPDVIGLIAA